MRWIFLALMLIAMNTQSQEPPKSLPANQKAATEQRSGEQSPLLLKTLAPNTEAERNYEVYEKQEKPKNERRITTATVALAWITLALAVFTAGLWLATYGLVKGAKETAERELRAYIGVENIFLRGPTLSHLGANPKLPDIAATPDDRVFVRIRNFGRTPAYDTKIWTDWQGISPFGAPPSMLLPSDFFSRDVTQLKENH